MRLPPNMELGAGDSQRKHREAAEWLYAELTRRYDGQDGPPLSFCTVNAVKYPYSSFGYRTTRELVEDFGEAQVAELIVKRILLEFTSSDLKGPLVWRMRPTWEVDSFDHNAQIYFRCALIGGGDPTKLGCYKPEGAAPLEIRL